MALIQTIPDDNTLKPSIKATIEGRLISLDALRGLIIMLMAIDHASYFIARVHSAEFWGSALPVYSSGFWFWTRWVTHLCAPGFFFLMGAGMILLADARRNAGWEENQITRFFFIRGLFLIFLQLFVEDPAWIFGSLTVNRNAMVIRGGGVPGGGSACPSMGRDGYWQEGSSIFPDFSRRTDT